MNLRNPDETKKMLNDPIHVHYHHGYREPFMTPLAMVDLEELHADTLSLIQKLQDDNAEKDERIRVLESRNNALYHTILGVMHFVDKWIDDTPAYDPDEDLNGTTAIGRASQAREIALQAIAQLQAERDAAVVCIGKLTVILKKYPYAATNGCAYEAYMEIKKYIEAVRGVQKEE